MKPNDKAIEAALLAAKTVLRNDEITIDSAIFAALDAAYAAQFQSEDYADLIRSLRGEPPTNSTLDPLRAAVAIEGLLADRDALSKWKEDVSDAMRIFERYRELEAERDALAARLTLVDDEALVEIAVKEVEKVIASANDSETVGGARWKALRAAIAAIRPHIEAAERERVADQVKSWSNDPAIQLLAEAIRRGK